MRHAILVQTQRKCNNCEAPKKHYKHHFDCPLCNQQFCSECFEIVKERGGKYIGCPYCDEELRLPKLVSQ